MSFALPIAARFTTDQPLGETLARFFAALVNDQLTTEDYVVWGAVLLGVTCGLLGCFIVLRRQSLLGDAIGHAVLPGVCMGFLVAGARSTPALLAGALVAGLLAAALIGLLQRTTQLKTGECMGVVFTGFYGLGIVLLKYIQNLQGRETFLTRLGLGHTINTGQSGLDKFLFGQITSINGTDLAYMGTIALVAIAVVIVFWRKLAVSTFDEGFAFSVGLPIRRIHYLLTGLVTVAIVISIQAVGVVLVSAMLVTPAATAYLLTDRLHRMAVLSACFGAAAGVLGAFFSLFGEDLPTGSFMVLGASLLFALAFLLAPTHGLVPRWLRLWQRQRRTQAENLLRSLYILMERRHDPAARDRRFGVHDVASIRHEPPQYVHKLRRLAAREGWVERDSRDPMILTDDGLAEAKRVVRNHRLWELFLTQEAQLGSDHVHRDAEHIEHVLPRDVLARLEQMLDNPTADPHGRPIP
jgi:ABC-type Mn2+/Zn2+ transport system permease subunit/Mn-dependent DtxR family transcriptional regulator